MEKTDTKNIFISMLIKFTIWIQEFLKVILLLDSQVILDVLGLGGYMRSSSALLCNVILQDQRMLFFMFQ